MTTNDKNETKTKQKTSAERVDDIIREVNFIGSMTDDRYASYVERKKEQLVALAVIDTLNNKDIEMNCGCEGEQSLDAGEICMAVIIALNPIWNTISVADAYIAADMVMAEIAKAKSSDEALSKCNELHLNKESTYRLLEEHFRNIA